MDTSVVSHQNKEQKLFTASVRTLLSTYIPGRSAFQSRVAAKAESKAEPATESTHRTRWCRSRFDSWPSELRREGRWVYSSEDRSPVRWGSPTATPLGPLIRREQRQRFLSWPCKAPAVKRGSWTATCAAGTCSQKVRKAKLCRVSVHLWGNSSAWESNGQAGTLYSFGMRVLTNQARAPGRNRLRLSTCTNPTIGAVDWD